MTEKLIGGQMITLPKTERMCVRLSWEKGPELLECDLMAFMLDETGLISSRWDIIFYNVHKHVSRCIQHYGIRTEDGTDYDTIEVRPNKIPDEFESILFLTCVYEAAEKNQSLMSAKNLTLQLIDMDTNKVICSKEIISENPEMKSILLGSVKRDKDSWVFETIAQEDTEQLIGVLATRYGMRVDWRSDYKNADPANLFK